MRWGWSNILIGGLARQNGYLETAKKAEHREALQAQSGVKIWTILRPEFID